MATYLNLVSLASLLGFYGAMFILAGALPQFTLGVDDSEVVRSTISTTLGIAITTLPLWYLHWRALRRLWAQAGDRNRSYLFLVNSIAVLATAVTAGHVVRHTAALLLGTVPATDAGVATFWSTALRFVISALLWHHHWTVLQENDAAGADDVRSHPGVAAP